MKFRKRVRVNLNWVDPEDLHVDRCFLYVPHRVYLSKKDMLDGPMKPKQYRWAWWEPCFSRYFSFCDGGYTRYFFDEELEAKVQAMLAEKAQLEAATF